MEKEVIIVPKDKCALNVLAEMGEQIRNAWIFLHENAVEKLRKTADFKPNYGDKMKFVWVETEDYPKTVLYFEKDEDAEVVWKKVYRIEASDIAFEDSPKDPEFLFFLKMQE